MLTARALLGLLLILNLATGIVTGFFDARHRPEPLWWSYLSAFLFSFTMYSWYWEHSSQRKLARSWWRNTAVIFVSVVAIPYYVIRYRGEISRFKAFAQLTGYLILLVIAAGIGGAAGASFS